MPSTQVTSAPSAAPLKPPMVIDMAPETVAPAPPTLDQIAAMNPSEAMMWLTFNEKLLAARALEAQKAQHAALQVSTLREIQKKEKRVAGEQAGCHANQHRRSDGSCAIVGQEDSQHVFRSACVRCQKTFDGVGDGPNQLPAWLASQINPDAIGR